ncbi:cyclophilin family peptidyl-prolyl cis-trans isomerase [Prosthecobacter fusiformis]|uniref:Cyclophilin family peptidyl-prolyl cis-trans isomerase n=1 Tax=Prosthecobacter fusiformis TaxID=48464 RepID=A0A4R7SQU2_9BACT|nr:immunoglobulin domain-containing protein [Prosthecobacter fusiformis]TDU81632.1 cyclophilin family peptidyl-prolyl cis-trans isomerase [Prosthecobacter fusiformis]
MLRFPDSISRHARALMLPMMVVLAGLAGTASAVAPKAPTNLVLKSTMADAPTAANTKRNFLLTWKDNSLDESGFRVEYRLGNAGIWNYYTSVNAGVTYCEFIGVQLPVDTLFQVRVVAFKSNGSSFETAASSLVDQTIKTTGSTLSAPQDFRVATYSKDNEVSDGILEFSWKDNSTGELYFQIFYKKASLTGDENYAPLPGGLSYFDNKEALTTRTTVWVQHGLVPNQAYHFMLRATRKDDATATEVTSNTASEKRYITSLTYPGGLSSYTVPAVKVPTNLQAEKLDESNIRLTWEDNTDNETGYEISYRKPVENESEAITWNTYTMAANSTSITAAIGPGGTYIWKVRAVPPTGSPAATSADYTDELPVIMDDLISPGQLVATTSGKSAAVDLTWGDNTIGETIYRIYVRPSGGTSDTWYDSMDMQPGTTKATVTGYNTSSTTSVLLTPNVEYEFRVDALHSNFVGDVAAAESNVARAYARHGFTSRTHQPAKVNDPFTYQMAVSDSPNRTSWSVDDLPPGLEMNADGLISGTPTESGVFHCPMEVVYPDNVAEVTLTLRILKDDATPVLASPITDVILGTATQHTIDLNGRFTDADSEKAVRLDTSLGIIDLLLYDSLTPKAVENFMGYVETGAYNGVIFHRSIPGFILQGGGYVPTDSPNYFTSLLKRPPSENEPGISNVRGTVAHAKVGDNPDSATHDFFFNLVANNDARGVTNYVENLDNQNSGFTVFGRVAGSGMDLVDDMVALPIGDYSPSSSDTTTGVILDGYQTEMVDVPMNVTGGTAPAKMDINSTVQIRSAKEVALFKYEVVENSAPTIVRTSILNGVLRLEGLLAGTSTVTVRARDLDNNPVEDSFTVTVIKGHKLPVITRQPVSLAVLPDKKATLSVTATGTALTYQWQKRVGEVWENVPDTNLTAKKNVLTFAALQNSDTGEYRVLVSNISMTLTSVTARLDFRAPPVIDTHPVRKVVKLGDPLVLTTEVRGAPVPTITWLRTNSTVSGQKAAVLNIPVTKLTDGGSYVMRASNVVTRADSSAASVIVVDKSSRLMMSLPAKTVVLKAQVSGPNLKYQWKKDSTTTVIDIPNKISGAASPTLTIKTFGQSDTGEYTCYVEDAVDASHNAETGPWRVGFAGAAPTLAAFTPPDAYVGIEYDYQIPGGGDTNFSIASFSLTGLPTGLKLDTVTGRITGKATRYGQYIMKLTAKNPKGSSTLSNITMNVRPMPEAVVGSFVGQIANSTYFNNNMGGRVDMTVTDTGVISGKLSQGKEVISFTGLMTQTPGSIYTSGKATIIRKGKDTLTLTLSSIAPSGYDVSGDVSGIITDGENAVAFSAYRNKYNSARAGFSGYVGRHHVALTLTGDDVGNEAVPQGTGYLVVTTDNNGTAKMSGRMADGTTVTASSFVGGQEQFLVYQSLYKSTGSVIGQPKMLIVELPSTQNSSNFIYRLDGAVAWTKAPQTTASERNYKAGFSTQVLSVRGGTYLKPGTNKLILDLPKDTPGNASIDFEDGGLEFAGMNPDVAQLSIGTSKLIPITPGVANAGGLSLTITPDVGLISGSFKVAPTGAPSRTATFLGLIIPRIPTAAAGFYYTDSPAVTGADGLGVGYFLLGQLPSDTPPTTTIKTAPILSGSVVLNPLPVLITQHPQSVTLNPTITGQAAVDHTFTVVATPPTGISVTYQWRKDGVNISGKTASTLALTNITESSQGTYDVVVKTSLSTVTSQPAVLTVNNLITNIVVTRTPATNPVPIGSSTPIVFEVTSVAGTGPYTYQWRKANTDDSDEDDIAGETSDTYSITNVTSDSAGKYYVVVTDTSTGHELKSSANVLTVDYPITSVVAQRTPPEDTIGYGYRNLTFSLTVDSQGPYEYQWYKVVGDENVEIQGATSATYTIGFLRGADQGVYKVGVKNAVTTDYVISEGVPLLVSSSVSNVSLTRSPSDTYVPLGKRVVFSAEALGEPEFGYVWKKDGEIIENATSSTYEIPELTSNDEGEYTVTISNNINGTPSSVESSVKGLNVQLPVTSVSVTRNPDTLTPPLNATFSMTATPSPAIYPVYFYQWYKNGEEIEEGGDSAQYTITTPTTEDSGTYHVTVRNAANLSPIASETFSLSFEEPTVEDPPEEDPPAEEP